MSTTTNNVFDGSQVFIIYHKETLKQLTLRGPYSSKSYDRRGDALRVLTRAINSGKVKAGVYDVTDMKNFRENIDYMVETRNMLNPGKPVKIRKSQLGSCTDPGTERYHCM